MMTVWPRNARALCRRCASLTRFAGAATTTMKRILKMPVHDVKDQRDRASGAPVLDAVKHLAAVGSASVSARSSTIRNIWGSDSECTSSSLTSCVSVSASSDCAPCMTFFPTISNCTLSKPHSRSKRSTERRCVQQRKELNMVAVRRDATGGINKSSPMRSGVP